MKVVLVFHYEMGGIYLVLFGGEVILGVESRALCTLTKHFPLNHGLQLLHAASPF